MSTDSNRIIIFDTTLRDGEQAPGATMTFDEKVQIASYLEDMGVDVIEAGFPIASEGDFHAVSEIAKLSKTATISGLSRAVRGDIKCCFDAVHHAAHHRIHIVIAVSALHMKYKLQIEPDDLISRIEDSVRYARTLAEDVEWSAEDATRADPDFLCYCVETAIKAGATTVNIPDTVGYTVPEEYYAMIQMLKNRVPNIDKAVISTHCHNDLGLAIANSLAAIQGGARQVECTINGLGERAGNAALEEIVMALRTRQDILPYTTGIKTEMITRASRMVSAATGFSVQPNKAIVGKNAFAHESGIHQDGMLKHAGTYEIMTPQSIGLDNANKIVLGKHSDRHAFKDKLAALGYELGDNALNDVFKRFKDLADQKKDVYDEDIIALVDDEVMRVNERVKLKHFQVTCGTHVKEKIAALAIEIDGKERKTIAAGDGPVDAAFKAIKEIVPLPNAHLELYQVHAVTKGTDAQAKVTVRLEENGKTVNGRGADVDTVVASIHAYLNALNKLLVNHSKDQKENLKTA
ncbi:MAG: 2-isopropylmalate synthase [Terasakiella sp.]|uniref:2-isopropylmalate synthase n=1 Tax=unclassified Terasakiella TaxID=2614952 RepID=UPI003B004127